MYVAADNRYTLTPYARCGRNGLKLPRISLGLWHTFGDTSSPANAREMLLKSFDHGITHFDLANNYGPPPGSAEANFGRILKEDLAPYRDELIISTKAGYDMWPGPYGEWGSRKYLLASLDQSLRRMGLDYVDIFYSHRPDPETPLEETMLALDQAVRSGKALYAGVSNYNPEQTAEAAMILRSLRTPFVIHQMKYSMFVRTAERGLFDVLRKEGIGTIAFTPLAQGLLTDRYLKGIPSDSRAAKASSPFLKESDVTEQRMKQVRALGEIAKARGQGLAQMALAWVLRQEVMASALIGASRVEQIEQNVAALGNLQFSADELRRIDEIAGL